MTAHNCGVLVSWACCRLGVSISMFSAHISVAVRFMPCLSLKVTYLSRPSIYSLSPLCTYSSTILAKRRHRITVKVKRTDNSDYELLKTSFIFEGEETVLSDIIYYWLQDNTVDNNPTRMLSPNVLTFNQVMIPLTKVGRRGAIQRIDVNEYLTSLQSFLRSNFDIESTVYMRGPSEGWIIL